MSGFHEIEALYKTKLKELQQNIANYENDDLTSGTDIESYLKRQEMKSYINNYRSALTMLKDYGKGYIGHDLDPSWVEGLSWTEKIVFKMRFKEGKTFTEIRCTVKVTGVKKIYESAYRKVIANIQKKW